MPREFSQYGTSVATLAQRWMCVNFNLTRSSLKSNAKLPQNRETGVILDKS